METGKLIIDWGNIPMYNTIMALATGAALCSLAKVGYYMVANKKVNPIGWSLNFAVLGLLLFTTGLHMTLTWPIKFVPFDNIVFGEPTLAFGSLLLALSLLFWKKSDAFIANNSPIMEFAKDVRHFKFLLWGLGLALIGIAIAGITYQLFAAPPEEPISGEFADYPMLESLFISGLWAFTGVVSLLTPSILDYYAEGNTKEVFKVKFTYKLTLILGAIFLLFGAFNYFTHIGLIVNTMK